jgi:hypothetical protein
MTWNPNCTVTVAGVDFSSKAINAVSVTYGRTSYWEQARTGYSTVEIVNWDDTDYAFEINDSVVVTVDNASAVARTVFTGKVTNITSRMVAVGSVEEVAVITVTAVGPFAAMSRKVLSTSYPREMDSTRMSAIFTDAGVTVDTVDTPGIYEFSAISTFTADAYATAAKYAGMANGYIYETTDGEVGFANESRRTVDVDTNGYMTIPENYILWRSVSSSKSLADVLNAITLTYHNNGVVTASDATSQGLYGVLGSSVSTELHNTSEAQELADKYVALRRVPQLNMSSFTIQLDSPNVTSADLDAFLQMTMGKAISISGLPVPLMPTNYYGFVEGWNLQVSRNQAAISLITSESSYSIQPTRWQDVSASLAWNAVGAAVQWITYD